MAKRNKASVGACVGKKTLEKKAFEENIMPNGGPSKLFILRPVATSLLMIGLLLVGVVAYLQLRSLPFPRWTIPQFRSSLFIRERDRR